jgi:hypothetical protein
MAQLKRAIEMYEAPTTGNAEPVTGMRPGPLPTTSTASQQGTVHQVPQVDKAQIQAPPVPGARQGKDGNWYVEQNGKFFRVEP